MENKQLKKSNNKMFSGVCAGLAEYLGWDVTATRIAYAALSLFTAAFPGLILYILMALIMPQPDGME